MEELFPVGGERGRREEMEEFFSTTEEEEREKLQSLEELAVSYDQKCQEARDLEGELQEQGTQHRKDWGRRAARKAGMEQDMMEEQLLQLGYEISAERLIKELRSQVREQEELNSDAKKEEELMVRIQRDRMLSEIKELRC